MHDEIDSMFEAYETGRLSRRELLVRLFAVAGAFAGVARASGAESASAGLFQAVGLNHIALRVRDVDRSREFYQKHLGMKAASVGSRSAFLTFGGGFLALFRGDDPGLDHYCYSVENYDADDAERKLKEAGLPSIQRTSDRIYFDDPDGIQVQLAAPRHMP